MGSSPHRANHIDGLVQDCNISGILTMESCVKLIISDLYYVFHNLCSVSKMDIIPKKNATCTLKLIILVTKIYDYDIIKVILENCWLTCIFHDAIVFNDK